MIRVSSGTVDSGGRLLITASLLVVFILGLLVVIDANAAPCWSCSHRSKAAIKAFVEGVPPYDKWKPHPCPYTKEQGCIVDHIKSLKCGGQDAPENMQWQDVKSSRKKDRIENLGC